VTDDWLDYLLQRQREGDFGTSHAAVPALVAEIRRLRMDADTDLAPPEAPSMDGPPPAVVGPAPAAFAGILAGRSAAYGPCPSAGCQLCDPAPDADEPTVVER
jgi:hypothetical protein